MKRSCSVKCAATSVCPTETRDLFILNWELVVVRDLLVDVNVTSRVDDNFLERFYRDDLGHTVGL